MEDRDFLEHTVNIISAWTAKNTSSPEDLVEAISAVHQSLKRIASGGSASTPELTPAVPIKKSITPDYIICLEDGKQLKMLKRHLMTAYGMTADEYRRKWGLPPDYPMVAPNYAETRSKLAKSIGLGQTRKSKGEVVAEPAVAEPAARKRPRKQAAA